MRGVEQALEHAANIQRAVAEIKQNAERVEALLNVEAVKPPPPPEYSFGGSEIRRTVCRDPHKLLKPFADKVEIIFQRLREQGHEPLCWETYRSPDRALRLAKKGTGIIDSMHCYGAAVDIVDADGSPWNDEGEGLWKAIETEALALGLFVLYTRDGKRKDFPHVQAVAVADQYKFRLMSEADRIAFLGGA